MSEPLFPAADARLENNAVSDSARDASNTMNTTAAPTATIVDIPNFVIYLLVFVDGTGLVLNVLVFIVLIQVSLLKTKAFCLARCSCPLLSCAPFNAYAVVIDTSSCGGADCWRRCRTWCSGSRRSGTRWASRSRSSTPLTRSCRCSMATTVRLRSPAFSLFSCLSHFLK